MSLNGSIAYIIEGTFAVGVLGLMWKISTDNNKKVDTIFKRFDDYKQSVKKEHVSKDVCDVVREGIGRDIKEIKTDVKLLLRRNGVK